MRLTGGQCGDRPQFIPVVSAIRVPRPSRGRPRTRPERFLADKAYPSNADRDYLEPETGDPVKADERAATVEGGRTTSPPGHALTCRRSITKLCRPGSIHTHGLRYCVGPPVSIT